MFPSKFPIRSVSYRGFVRRQSTIATPSPGRPFLRITGVGVASSVLGWFAYEFSHSQNEAGVAAKHTISTALSGAPNLNPATGYPFTALPPLSPAQVDERLNEDAWSVSVSAVNGLSSYEGSQVASNGPCEDSYIHGKFPSPLQSGRDWMTWGVFDGHLGSQTSQALTQHLLPYVHTFVKNANQPTGFDDVAIHKAIKDAFVALDNAFLSGGDRGTVNSDSLTFAQKVQRLATGSNGSCAILSLYDPASRKLHVACTGDSRAVLGRQTAEGKWEAVPLSIDQSGSNEAEGERVRAEHPGEEGLVKNGRVLGLACARAFGDGHWKWPLELQKYLRSRFVTDTLRAHDPEVYKTPPYITAEPEVTTTVLPAGKRAFMIIASDGLWDAMTSEQAVDMVARWIDWKAKRKPREPQPVKGETPGMFNWERYYSTGYKVDEESIAVQDENAAVHLTRNAIGGANQDLVGALLSFRPPYSRYVRDDITVQVVFFE
ncbi:putative pyruvate dehydrogenase [Apodospora peruviana]|uniref:Pyruvate dehydrogenase n=1 Tax=Apodospora peruviana TaxID=516989 RepID=A0AAE0I5U8_9PEZI|nr:putative pyruvate dehydrogenase [Apodospora peruviana]